MLNTFPFLSFPLILKKKAARRERATFLVLRILFNIENGAYLAGALVGALVDVGAVAASTVLEAGVALALVAARRVAAAAAAAHVGVVAALVHVLARVPRLRRLVARVAHAFVPDQRTIHGEIEAWELI